MKTITAIITFPLLCLLLSFAVLITDSTFTYQLLDNPDAHQPTQELLGYFIDHTDMPTIFNEQEAAHLSDVKDVIWASFVVLLFLSFFHFRATTRQNWKRITQNGTMLLIGILLLASIIPFQHLFTWFHHIAFAQGNWQFPIDSTLIQYYPQSFFQAYALAIGLYSLTVAGILLFLSHVGDKKSYTK